MPADITVKGSHADGIPFVISARIYQIAAELAQMEKDGLDKHIARIRNLAEDLTSAANEYCDIHDIFDLASDYCAAVFTGDTLNADAIRYELRRLGMFADHDDKRFACIVAGTHSLLAYPLDCEIVEDTHRVTLYKLDTDSACRHFARLVA